MLFYVKFYALDITEDFRELDGYFKSDTNNKCSIIRKVKEWCKLNNYVYIRTVYYSIYER